MTEVLISELDNLGIKIVTHKSNHFDSVTIDTRESGFSSTDFVLAEFHKFGINLRKIDEYHVGISLNELTTMVDLDELIEIFADLTGKRTTSNYLPDTYYEDKNYKGLPAQLKRSTTFM